MNINDRKNLVFDLDGTLLNNKYQIPEEAQKTIKELKSKGYKFYINTGRPTKAIEPYLNTGLFDGYATFNGAEVKIGESIKNNPVSISKALKMLEGYDLGPYSLTTQLGDTLYVSNREFIQDVIDRTHPGSIEDVKDIPSDEAFSIRIVFPSSESAAFACKTLSEGTKGYTIAHSTKIYVIVNDGNASKSNIFDVLGKETCIFFGDSGNDLVVFEDKDIYCMCPSNSIPAIKDIADVVLEESNEGNILKYLSEL